MQLTGPLAALKMALATNPIKGKKLIHHSDRGLQYCSKEYIALLKKSQVAISMTHDGDPGENAIAERVNGTIKNEFYCRGFLSFPLAQEGIARAIHAYNHLRPHASCDYLMPAQAHCIEGSLTRRWPMNSTKQVIMMCSDNLTSTL
jgi:transposase InsO family protein